MGKNTILKFIKPAKFGSMLFLVVELNKEDLEYFNIKTDPKGNKWVYISGTRIMNALRKQHNYVFIECEEINFTNKQDEYITYYDNYIFQDMALL